MPEPSFYSTGGKRAFDLLVSAAALICLTPLLAAISFAVALSSRGGVLFRQQRTGKAGVPFTILKFRTMVSGAERLGPGITRRKDPRVTWIGSFLRRYKLDELPQLVNVLRGEMSLVGPRPELPEYTALYIDRFLNVLQIRPGITDLASLTYRNEESLLEQAHNPEIAYRDFIMPAKLELNLEYKARMSFCYDLTLIMRTLLAISHTLPTPVEVPLRTR